MANVFKISEAASLALHATALLAAKPDGRLSVKVIAEKLNVSEAHLSKVLQRLGKAGYVGSSRGPRGGFVLNRKPTEVSLLEVYECIEGPFDRIECLFSVPVCSGEHCIFGGCLETVFDYMKTYLEKTRLSDLKKVYRKEVSG